MKSFSLTRVVLILSFFALLASCKKNNSGKNSAPVDVYLTGLRNDTAMFWKNGTASGGINGGVSATSIFVSGTDIYVVGEQIRNGNFVAAVWKNGIGTVLADQSQSPLSYAYSVTVSGGDVYVAGYTYSTGNVATYWKNQSPVYVGPVGSTATSIYVSGSDVYVAGGSSINGMFVNAATLWKNGTATTLTKTGEAGYAYSVYVAGSDVYAAGFKYAIGSINNTVALYWKNGVATTLSANNAEANSIYVSGNDVYVTGYDVVNGVTVATYWKNGVATHLTSGISSYGSSLAVSGKDVYVAGNIISTGGSPRVTLWKNGVANMLEPGYSMAYGLFIK